MVEQVGEDGSITQVEFDPFNHSTSMDLSQRLMHRFPGDTETQKNWKWMRFLPPAHLCPQCCTKQKWRKKVILVRNPFVRLASMFQFAWLPSSEHPSERRARVLKEQLEKQKALQKAGLKASQ